MKNSTEDKKAKNPQIEANETQAANEKEKNLNSLTFAEKRAYLESLLGDKDLCMTTPIGKPEQIEHVKEDETP